MSQTAIIFVQRGRFGHFLATKRRAVMADMQRKTRLVSETMASVAASPS